MHQRVATTAKQTTSNQAAETTALLSWRRPGMVGCGLDRVCERILATLVASQTFCRRSTGNALQSRRVRYAFRTENWIRRDRVRENWRRIWKPATSVYKVCVRRCGTMLFDYGVALHLSKYSKYTVSSDSRSTWYIIQTFSKATTSVPEASNKLRVWLSEWLSDWIRDFSPQASSPTEAAKKRIWHKGSLENEDDVRTSSTLIAQRKRAIPHSTMKTHHNMTSVLVTALCNQPEAFAWDLGKDESRYLCC